MLQCCSRQAVHAAAAFSGAQALRVRCWTMCQELLTMTSGVLAAVCRLHRSGSVW